MVEPLLAPVLGARKDASVGVDSASALLMTVMGELMLPSEGEAWTQTLIEVLDGLGVGDKATRQTLARTADRGWLEREKVGRRTRWRLTPAAVDLLEAGAERIYGFGRSGRAWDERWLVVLASVPERERKVRYRMGMALTWAGFGSLGQGVWLSPWVDQEQVAAERLRELGVDATSFVAELGQLGDAADLTQRAWDVPGLCAEYQGFLDATAEVDATATGIAAVTGLVGLVHRWRRFPFLDPDLPGALLPGCWPGPVAADRFAQLRSSLLGEARDWWTATESRLTP